MAEKSASLRESYQTRVANGELKPNAAQAETIEILQSFADRLRGYEVSAVPEVSTWMARLGSVFGVMGKTKSDHGSGIKSGLYIHGKVGRGKSMLMDLFMEHVAVVKKRRVHFHQFMLEIHERLNQLRQGAGVPDIMDSLVRGIAAETMLLAFDEFHVSNIADAMILGRLFSGLFAAGVIVIVTSNWAPDELYKNGLQRDRFLPFIDLIKEKMLVHEIGGKVDYRYEQLRNLKSYFHPLSLENTRKLQGIFFELTHDAPAESMTLPVGGRELHISRAAQGVGFFNFDELCQKALGAEDYLAIAECLNTVILDGVPLFKAEQRDEALRFMTLIDTLYEAKVKLFMAVAAPIERLTVADNIAIAFQRTVSRLMEMQGEAYRLKPHLHVGS